MHASPAAATVSSTADAPVPSPRAGVHRTPHRKPATAPARQHNRGRGQAVRCRRARTVRPFSGRTLLAPNAWRWVSTSPVAWLCALKASHVLDRARPTRGTRGREPPLYGAAANSAGTAAMPGATYARHRGARSVAEGARRPPRALCAMISRATTHSLSSWGGRAGRAERRQRRASRGGASRSQRMTRGQASIFSTGSTSSALAPASLNFRDVSQKMFRGNRMHGHAIGNPPEG